MSSLSIGGLISGTNTESLIYKIMEVERTRLYTKEAERSNLQAKQKAWESVRSSISTLRSKLDTLRFPFIFRSRSVTMTDSSVADVTAASGAALTTYSLSVSKLAQAHVVSHTDATTKSTLTDTLGFDGSFNIGLGSATKLVSFTQNDTLSSLADKINAAGAGVNASVVKVTVSNADAYRLVLTSSKTGTANAVVMTDATAGTLQSLGIKDASNNYTNVLSTAEDATFKLNGIDYTRSTNTVNDIVSGLSMTLKKQGADATTQFTVGIDADKVLEAVKGWIDAVNSTQDLLKKLSDYNPDTKQAGVLNGEGLIRSLQRQIRSSVSNVVTGLPADLNQMFQVGITTGAYGTDNYGKVVIDEAKFKEKLIEDADGVAKLFGAMQNNPALPANGGSVALNAGSATDTSDPAKIFDINDVINGVTDGARFGSTGGGWQSANPPSMGAQGFTLSLSGAKTIDSITLFQPDPSDTPASTHGLKDFLLEYYDSATLTWKTIESVTNFGGASKRFEFDPITTDQVRISVTATHNDHKVRITEMQIGEYNNGAAIDMYRYVRSILQSQSGALDAKDTTLTKQVDRVNEQIERIEKQLVEREERLRLQFARMEQALAKLRSQGSAFAMQMAGMPM